MGYIRGDASGRGNPDVLPSDRKDLSEDEKREVIGFLSENPLAGDEIPGTGGVRKLRVAASGRGKRGGARIVYLYLGKAMPIYALLAYAKSRQADLAPDERQAVTALATAIKRQLRKRPHDLGQHSPDVTPRASISGRALGTRWSPRSDRPP